MMRSLIHLSLFYCLLVACIPVTPVPPTPSPQPTASPVPTPTLVPTAIPISSASGLRILTREIQGQPALDPLDFTTVQGEHVTAQLLLDQRGPDFPDHSYFKDMQYSMWAQIGADRLIAREYYDDSNAGSVDVTRAGREIYTVAVGQASPVAGLRGLWVYDDHWLLETAFITVESKNNSNDTQAIGKLFQDAASLNDSNGYEEAFGLQTIAGRPFYFFDRGGVIDAWYDGHAIPLGYDRIPHYGCCTAAELNPYPSQDGVTFFGVLGEKWYFVRIGTPDSLKP